MSVVLLCDFLPWGLAARSWARPWPPWRELRGHRVPVVDPRLLVTPQHLADHFRYLRRRRTRTLQQLREDRPHLRHCHGRCFFPPTGAAPVARTTTPAATASCDGASPANCAPRSGPAHLLFALLQQLLHPAPPPMHPGQLRPPRLV